MEALTRAKFRERVRHSLGKRTARDEDATLPYGFPASTHPFPSNTLINEKLDEAVATINRKCDLGFVFSTSVSVEATTSSGAQRVNLRYSAVPSLDNRTAEPGAINNIKRAYFVTESDSTPQPLIPLDRAQYDRQGRNWEQEAAGTPRYYWQDGTDLYLLPGSSSDITLNLMAGTGIIGFSNDEDVLLQLPNDYGEVVEALTVTLVAQTQMRDTEMRDYAALYGSKAQDGIADIRAWKRGQTEEMQAQIHIRTGRTYVGRR